VKREMAFNKTISGKVVSCAVCSWWAPLMGDDIAAISKEFDAHICADDRVYKKLLTVPTTLCTGLGTVRSISGTILPGS
jgi:hypothetical protein